MTLYRHLSEGPFRALSGVLAKTRRAPRDAKESDLSQRRRDRRVTKKITMLWERIGNGCFERV